jgi:hypothetical protein
MEVCVGEERIGPVSQLSTGNRQSDGDGRAGGLSTGGGRVGGESAGELPSKVGPRFGCLARPRELRWICPVFGPRGGMHAAIKGQKMQDFRRKTEGLRAKVEAEANSGAVGGKQRSGEVKTRGIRRTDCATPDRDGCVEIGNPALCGSTCRRLAGPLGLLQCTRVAAQARARGGDCSGALSSSHGAPSSWRQHSPWFWAGGGSKGWPLTLSASTASGLLR